MLASDSDLEEANRKARQLRVKCDATIERQRQQLNPLKVERITPEMAQFLAEKAVHDTLAGDEKSRTDPTDQEGLLLFSARVSSVVQGGCPGDR
jgi:hypothetical protein